VALNAVTTRDKNTDKAPGDQSAGNNASTQNNNASNARSSSSDDDIEEVVFVLQKDNKVKKVKVRTGIQDLNNIEILGGLSDGDQVITGPYNIVSKTLKDGNLVTVVPKDKLFEEKKAN
jgi:HlyD family secretion protein